MGSRADDNPFKRGGVRSTAGPRLGGGSHAKKSRYQPAKSDSFLTPFKAWSADQVSHEMLNTVLLCYIISFIFTADILAISHYISLLVTLVRCNGCNSSLSYFHQKLLYI